MNSGISLVVSSCIGLVVSSVISLVVSSDLGLVVSSGIGLVVSSGIGLVVSSSMSSQDKRLNPFPARSWSRAFSWPEALWQRPIVESSGIGRVDRV